jgi:cobalt-zinc-cadmium efflux system membrane fusion protein
MKCMVWSLVLWLPLAGCRPTAEATPVAAAADGEIVVPAAKAQAVGIVVQTIQLEDLDRELIAAGRVTFDDQHVAHVLSPVSGRVVSVLAPVGAKVRRGDALARIDSPELGSADADLTKAQAAHDAAEREFQRQRELVGAKAAAQRDLEAAESNARQAAAELSRARSKATLLGVKQESKDETFVLRAPIDGEVISRSVNPGSEVQGQYAGGAPPELFTIGQLESVWVLADVFEMDLSRVHLRDPVDVEVVAYPGQRFQGRVEWIAAAVDPATRTAKVRVTLANPQGALKPEMYATVAIHVPGRPALAVPRAALLRQGAQTVVFRELGATARGDLRFARWPVKVDDEGEDRPLPVLEGLKPGDRVVTSGAILLLGMT